LEKLNKFFKSKSASAAILSVVILLVMLMLFTTVMEYIRIKTISKGIRDSLESSVISVVIQNWDNNFESLRQGYSGGYNLDETNNNWDIDIDEGAVFNNLGNALGLSSGGNLYYKFAGNKIEYYLYDLDVNVTNAKFRGDGNDEFKASAEIILEVPFKFGWDHVPNLKVPLKLNAKFTPKF
jgi:hypothetical protein